MTMLRLLRKTVIGRPGDGPLKFVELRSRTRSKSFPSIVVPVRVHGSRLCRRSFRPRSRTSARIPVVTPVVPAGVAGHALHHARLLRGPGYHPGPAVAGFTVPVPPHRESPGTDAVPPGTDRPSNTANCLSNSHIAPLMVVNGFQRYCSQPQGGAFAATSELSLRHGA